MAEEPSLHRIAKLLARAGVASRRDVERMIEEGRVAVNGDRLDTPATLLPTLAGVTVDGEPVAEAEPTRLFLFHKPAGYLTAARDPMGRPTIYDRLPADLPRLVPVGRLDLNTEGLLLLTTDGAFKRQLELPSTGVERAYRARAYGDVTQAQLEALIDGVEIDGIRYGSIDANLERRTGANVWVEMILTEGKNREVRRVLEYLGLQVSRLIRTRYGPFVMGDLPVGGIGEVRGADLVAFRNSLKGNRLAPDQAGTITASAIRPGAAARTAVPARSRSDQSPDPTNTPAPLQSRDTGYDPTHTPRAGDDRVRTRGAFGTRPTRNATREDDPRAGASGRGHAPQRAGDRTTARASTQSDQRRARPPQSSNEPNTARSRRPTPTADQSRARPSRDTASRDDRARPQRPTRDGHASRAARDSARPENGRSQRPNRAAPDARANQPAAQRDEPSAPTRPPRPERKPGWARAKPKSGAKPGTRPGKPRK